MDFNPIAADHLHSILRHGLLLCLLLILLPSTAVSQSPPPGSDDSSDMNGLTGNFNPSMGVIVIVLIAALFFMGFFSIYIRHCSDDESPSVTRRTAGQAGRSRRNAPRGLDPSVLASFPVFDYADVKSLKIGKGALECAVCLNEFEDDETLRLIPKCDHVFHPDCIDAWLAAHTTCPVCRANLVPQAGESVHEAHQAHEEDGDELIDRNDDVVVDIPEGQAIGFGSPTGPGHQCVESESMEQPLNAGAGLPPPARPRLYRNRTSRNLSGRPKWFGKFSRSNSTGHVAVKQWENMERFTLRLPEEVRRQILSGKLNRTTSCIALPGEGSSRRGNRAWAGPGEGSSRGRNLNSGRFDRAGRSDRWVFSLAPPFFSRAPSMRSPRVTAAASMSGSVRSNKAAAESVHAADSATEPKLPPV